MEKHILFIVENQPVPYDTRVWAEALDAKDSGYEVSVICPQMEKAPLKREKLNGIEIYRHYFPLEAAGKFAFLLEYSNALFWELLLSLWIFIKKPFHIIHAANPPDHIFIIALIFKVFGVKYIFDHHDITPENYLAKFGRKDMFYRSILIMEKLTFKTANVVISTNESYKKIAISRGKKHEKEVFVVRNGPRLSSIQFMEPNKNLREGFDFLIVYVGVIGNQEGIENLLNTAKYIVFEKGIKNVKFMIVGTGTSWQEMVNLTQEMGLTKYVEYTGFVPYEKFYEILATADICVNPEFRNDFTDKSTMVKILDYMTFGKPIVLYYTTEGKVTAGEASLYIYENDEIEFAKAIIDLLNDPEKREKMGEIGKRRIFEKLNWEHQRANLKKAYTHLEQTQ